MLKEILLKCVREKIKKNAKTEKYVSEKLRSETNVITCELLNSNELKVKFMNSEH
jgi:hypothetical protein